MEALDFIGILCIEFFITRDGRLLVNELAPRPHNSGHLTFDACRTSQFEQQLRAVCGLPLGSPEMLTAGGGHGEFTRRHLGRRRTDWAAALSMPDVKLHLYGKSSPRPGRKMGHLTVLAGSPERQKPRPQLARRCASSLNSEKVRSQKSRPGLLCLEHDPRAQP